MEQQEAYEQHYSGRRECQQRGERQRRWRESMMQTLRGG
jgi:hypothetical protein